MEFTSCKDCPCLNTDYEAGTSCNLGYKTGYVNTSFHLRTFRELSNNCELERVIYGSVISMEFTPDKFSVKDPNLAKRIEVDINR